MGLDAGAGFALGARLVGRCQVDLQGRDDLGGYFVLEGEDILDLAVVASRPKVPAVRRIDQLGIDPHRIAGLTYAAFEHILHAQFLADFLDVGGSPLEGERGISSDDEQPRNLGKISDQILGHAVGEIFLFRIARHVGERQHRD